MNKDVLFYLQAALGMGIRSGLYIFMLRQFFRNMPKELEEAAMIDGCGPMRTFTRIMLPNAVPMIATVLVFSLVWYWNDYYLSSMFYNGVFPVSVNLTELQRAAELQQSGLRHCRAGADVYAGRNFGVRVSGYHTPVADFIYLRSVSSPKGWNAAVSSDDNERKLSVSERMVIHENKQKSSAGRRIGDAGASASGRLHRRHWHLRFRRNH